MLKCRCWVGKVKELRTWATEWKVHRVGISPLSLSPRMKKGAKYSVSRKGRVRLGVDRDDIKEGKGRMLLVLSGAEIFHFGTENCSEGPGELEDYWKCRPPADGPWENR